MTTQSQQPTVTDPWQGKGGRYWLIAFAASLFCLAFAPYDGKGFYDQYLKLCSEQPGRGECRPLNLVKDVRPPELGFTLDYGKGRWALEVGPQQEEAQANDLAARLRSVGIEPRVIRISGRRRNKVSYQVQIGRFPTRKSATEASVQLQKKGLIQDFRFVDYQAVR
jgi:hypothetical protein